MKLYATVTSERATKGQGGKHIDVAINGTAPFPRIEVGAIPCDDKHCVLTVKHGGRVLLDTIVFMPTKGEKQKGECEEDGGAHFWNGNTCRKCLITK
jgi:hypothetical protein